MISIAQSGTAPQQAIMRPIGSAWILENLMRHELSPAERAEHMARRKVLYEAPYIRRRLVASRNPPE